MKAGIVPVKNIARLSAASKALLNRAPGAPGIALVEGIPGLGKSTATAWLSNQTPSIYVRALRLWTPSGMLGAICGGLRIPKGGSCSDMIERIVEELTLTGKSLFIDEADHLVRKTDLIETVRDIHDLSITPMILIGEENLRTKLAHLKRLASRVAQVVSFEPLDLADTQLIVRELCEVEIQPDLLEFIHRTRSGNCRDTVVALAQAEQIARSGGRRSLALADIGKKGLQQVGING